MKLLFAPDSFKGSASSVHIIKLLERAAGKYFEDCEIVSVPMADGGEGTLNVLVEVMGGRYEECTVTGPMGTKVNARYGVIENSAAVIEMAEASGLTLVPAEKRDPCRATSYGTGELVRHVLKEGYREILLAMGGSATNDGGMGAADALGIRFIDQEGHRLEPIGKNMGNIKEIQTDHMIPELKETDITIMCDVKNPLLGKKGATFVYGPQKGGDAERLQYLEEGMKHYADIVKKQFGKDVTEIEGCGAAGGLSIPFLIFGNAKIASGIQTVLERIRFDALLEGVDLVVTGEGRVDSQSACGKVLSGIGNACKERGIPVAAIVGGIGEGAEDIYDCGVDSIAAAVNDVMDLERAFENADRLIQDAAERMFRFIKMGMEMKRK